MPVEAPPESPISPQERPHGLLRGELGLYLSGQAVSLIGTWMHASAQAWLVHRHFRDPRVLGWLGFCASLPSFVLGAWGGALADRLPRRGLVLATQSAALLQALVLCWVATLPSPSLALLLTLAFLLGLVNAIDVPARQAWFGSLAGAGVQRAIALNATVVNGARVIGPALAGLVIASSSEAVCFALNAASYLAAILALLASRPRPVASSGRGAMEGLAEGLRFVTSQPLHRLVLALIALASLTATPYAVLLPTFADDVFSGGPRAHARLAASAGLGTFVAALLALRKDAPAPWRAIRAGPLTFALGLLLLSVAPIEPLAMGALVLVGFGFMTQMVAAQALLQSATPDALRGRVMGIYSTVFLGLGPFGALMLGQLAGAFGPRVAVGVGGVGLLLGGLLFRRASQGHALGPAPGGYAARP